MSNMEMTTTLQEAVANAQQIAQTRHHQEITISHLMKALVQPGNFAYNFYADLDVDMNAFEQELDRQLDKIAVVSGSGVQYGQQLSRGLMELIQKAQAKAESYEDDYLATEMILLALWDISYSETTKWLKQQGVTKAKTEAKIKDLRKGDRVNNKKKRTML